MSHWLIAALGNTTGISDFFQLFLSRAQFLKGSGQTDFHDEVCQGVNAGQGQFFIGFAIPGNPPHIFSKPDKLGQSFFVNMALNMSMTLKQIKKFPLVIKLIKNQF